MLLQRFSPAWGVFVLRVVTGLIFFVHGWQKLFEFGLAGTTGFFGSVNIPLPEVAAVIVIGLELMGGLALILGVFTRWVAIPLAFSMLVALFTVHLANGFFVANNGYELVLALFGAATSLVFLGSGALAVDNVVGTEQRSLALAR